VLIILRSFGAGGAERQLLEFLRVADKTRLSITVGCFYRGVWYDEATRIPDIEIVDLRKAGRSDVLPFFVSALRLARRSNPDVIYGYMGGADVVALVLSKAMGRRVVWGIRNSNMDLSHYGFLSRFLFRMSSYLSNWVDLFIANSEAGVAHYSSHGYPAGRFRVVPNGIDTGRFTRSEEQRRTLRRQLGASPDHRVAGLVGRLDPQKGHRDFLQAAAILTRRDARWKFVCVGGGDASYQDSLTALAASMGLAERVTWMGHMDNTSGVYSALDVCVLPSTWGEGFSNVVAESMACETPCVVTDVGDNRKIIDQFGKAVPPGDVPKLVEAIEWIIAQDLSALGCSARLRIEKEYSVRSMVTRTTEVIEGLIR
jgi:glycosyltransferase involved in cell wall biosynthesis